MYKHETTTIMIDATQNNNTARCALTYLNKFAVSCIPLDLVGAIITYKVSARHVRFFFRRIARCHLRMLNIALRILFRHVIQYHIQRVFLRTVTIRRPCIEELIEETRL